jgi:hypothetical protein
MTQIPAIIPPGPLATTTDTYLVPALIAHAGDAAGWRYLPARRCNDMPSRGARHPVVEDRHAPLHPSGADNARGNRLRAATVDDDAQAGRRAEAARPLPRLGVEAGGATAYRKR